MKKLFVIVLAAIGMVSCMNTDEVIEVKGGDAIAFADVMLDNAVRAAVDPSTTFETIQGFNVWGFMDDVKGVVFEGDEVTRSGEAWTYSPTQYWAPSHTYYFAALSPIGGQWTLNTANGGTLGAGIVNFVNNDGSEDLLYAKAIVTTEADINKQPGAVKLQFQHLLSKVKFTFKSEFPSERQTIKVKDIKMTAAKAGSIDLAVADYTKGWVLTSDQETYSFGDLENTLTINDINGWESAQERLLIPAAADYVYTITFTVEIYNGQNLAQTFNETTELTGKALEMGTAYNFVATLSPDNLGLYPIQFTVGVDSWVEEDVDVDYRTDIVYTAEELAAALTSNGDVNVILGANIDLPIAKLGQQTGGSGEYKLGGDTTGEINIDLNGKTLNVTTSYWSALGAKNDNATITIKNGKMTSTGNSAGTWNAWDLRFSNCNYVFEDVEFGKAVALDNVGKSTVMNKVTISDTHNTDTYGLWITAEGQTVTLNDCVIDMLAATDGRGIKIDEQYVGAPAKVTLNVNNVTFKTEEKAAILVKSVAGAEINVENINIADVAADNQFAVWVDEATKEHAAKVTVNGANVKVEGTIVNIVEVASVDALKDALVDAGSAGSGNTVINLAAGEYTMTNWTPITVDGYHGADIVTVDGNGAVLKGMTKSLFNGGFAGGSGIVIKNLTIEGAAIVADNTQGYGAFVNCADSMNEITLINCHLINSSIITPNDGANESRMGGLVGWTSGYSNVNDGPVKTYVNIKNCSVVGCTIKGAGSIGGICGHAGANDWTYTTIENCTVKNNTLISTDAGSWRVGVAVGTANVGQVVVNNLTESGNTLTQGANVAPTGVRSYAGRLALGTTGSFVVDGVAITE